MDILIPNNQLAEQIVLTAMLNDVDCYNEGMGSLTDKHFYDNNYKLIFQAIKTLYQEGVETNIYTLSLKVSETFGGLEKIGGGKTITELMNESPRLEDFEKFLDCLHENYQKRELIYIATKILEKDFSTIDSFSSFLEKYQKAVCEINNNGSSKQIESVQNLISKFDKGMGISEYIEEIHRCVNEGESINKGLTTGYEQLDELIGCFTEGSLTYVGARASMGKTTFVLNLILNQLFSKEPKKILFFSLEMDRKIILTKLIATQAGVCYKRLMEGKCSPSELNKFKKASESFRDKNIWIEDQGGLTISKIKSRIRRLAAMKGIDVVYIDYLTLVKSEIQFNNKHLEVDSLSKGLQHLAKELNIPIVCLAQLNRNVEGRTDKRPNLSDFRESGSIEEDADTAMLLYRPSYYDKHNKPGVMEVYVAKNRILGNLGKVDFCFRNGKLEEMLKIKDLYNGQ